MVEPLRLKPRALVVDDDPVVLKLLAESVARAGFEVTTARDGVEALEAVPGGFDVVTTDLDMPRMDGHEFIRRLHDLPIPPIPVVVVTGQPLDGGVAERIQACRVVRKPFRLEELARVLRLLVTTCQRDPVSCSTCAGLSRSGHPEEEISLGLA
jgi:two-component system response regulator MprA